MANETDPLANKVSGSDPQNLFEYITRQRIYDSRYWKEECFGLNVSDVLESAVQITFLGRLPSRALALCLKLLQLHPDHDIVYKAFVQQSEFKYIRALGILYIRMTSRPVEIYNSLEPLYSDYRKLRVWAPPYWKIITMDEFVRELLAKTTNCMGIALPRLPARRVLVENGYLPDGPRDTQLNLEIGINHGEREEDGDNDNEPLHPMLAYLRHRAEVDQIPAFQAAWEKRDESKLKRKKKKRKTISKESEPVVVPEAGDVIMTGATTTQKVPETTQPAPEKRKKKDRNYGNLFKKDKSKQPPKKSKKDDRVQAEEHSEEYWNEQRAKLGLGKLK